MLHTFTIVKRNGQEGQGGPYNNPTSPIVLISHFLHAMFNTDMCLHV